MPALGEMVKSASLPDGESLPRHAFAWPEERRFPVSDPQQAAISYAYATKVASSRVPREVVQEIEKALDLYGVSMSVFDEVKVAAAAPDPEQYLLPDLRILPVTDEGMAKTAQDKLEAGGYEKLDPERRVEAAMRLSTRLPAGTLRTKTAQLAGLVMADLGEAKRWIGARAMATKDEQVRGCYEKLAAELPSGFSRDRESMVKLAQLLGDLDERADLVKLYDRKIPDPVSTVFNTDKLASETVDLGGVYVPIAKLAAMPASFWEDLGGREMSDEVAPGGHVDAQKLAVVLDTLPMDLKVVLRRQMGC